MRYTDQINHIRRLAIDIHANARLTLREAMTSYGWTVQQYADELLDDHIAYETEPPEWWEEADTDILRREIARLVDVDAALLD